ncbi:hypothetical protein DWV22_05405 [Weissella confusa]|uniref:hypothetical protein n=1 Tax=Weissella confusa TaxID=1583 RepID=UPI000E472715|nr:hypothetical protein [Weissella confusa]RGX48677.1 hypothetical protein DWV22_05405 [Weissella confusa]
MVTIVLTILIAVLAVYSSVRFRNIRKNNLKIKALAVVVVNSKTTEDVYAAAQRIYDLAG